MSDFGMSGNELEQMYQEVILDAARNPHGKAHFAQDLSQEPACSSDGRNSANQGEATLRASHEYCTPGESRQFNPTCGDEVTVHVEISKDDPRRIERLVWDGQGCSISQASLSVMTDLISGKTVDEAMRLFTIFHALMQSRGAGLDNDEDDEALGDAVVFQGASKYPMRIKCALLGWEGLKDSLAKALAAQE
jgi:nitrogen fixation NifU-like protein